MYLAIIPARSGSKRIKNKNIKSFFGYPIIRYPIRQAVLSKLFKKIIVSTDSKKIKRISIKYGASVPFLRSKSLSNDFTPIAKVLFNVIQNIKNEFFPKYFCLIYATAALIDKKDLIKSIKILKKNKNVADGICSVCKYNLPIQRAFKINKKNFLEHIDAKYSLKRSQDLEESYYDAANFFWFNTKFFLEKKGSNLSVLPYVIHKNSAQDIDNLDDWKDAKKLYRLKNRFSE
jgi:pseudaminic acid cytidylyltransferase